MLELLRIFNSFLSRLSLGWCWRFLTGAQKLNHIFFSWLFFEKFVSKLLLLTLSIRGIETPFYVYLCWGCEGCWRLLVVFGAFGNLFYSVSNPDCLHTWRCLTSISNVLDNIYLKNFRKFSLSDIPPIKTNFDNRQKIKSSRQLVNISFCGASQIYDKTLMFMTLKFMNMTS